MRRFFHVVCVVPVLATTALANADGPKSVTRQEVERAQAVRDVIDNILRDAEWRSLEFQRRSTDLNFDRINFGMLQDAPPADAAPPAGAGGASADELSKKLSNPISDLISVPLQSNFIFGAGDDGFRYVLNVQPVIPISLNEDWNLIVRTIVPVIYQEDIVMDGGWDQFGLGDTVQSFFFSPKQPTEGGMTWGVGPVFLWPTATNDSLGGEKWGIGPTAVALWIKGPWTYGGLVNHIWSYAGDDDRADVNATFLQPFVAYQLGGGLSTGANMEMTYDWEAEEWTIPLYVQVSKVIKIGDQMTSIQVGPQFFLDAPPGGPDWAIRFQFTFLFPK